MTMARREQITIGEDCWLGICSRVVRRAWLCGIDPLTGVNHEHRRDWVVDRLKVLDQAFAVDIATYAIMSNHYHLVLHVAPAQAAQWSPEEVVRRWRLIYPRKGPVDEAPSAETIQLWRERLADLSWFMKSLNEYIARKANIEDKCKGRFWESRFYSQLLLDDAAVIACMAYVDLNPVRAGMCQTPEAAPYTGIKARIEQQSDPDLMAFILAKEPTSKPELNVVKGDNRIPIDFSSYLELLDYTGRELSGGKGGAIPKQLVGILNRLDIDDGNWVESIASYGHDFHLVVGHFSKLLHYAHTHGKRCVHGHRASKHLHQNH